MGCETNISFDEVTRATPSNDWKRPEDADCQKEITVVALSGPKRPKQCVDRNSVIMSYLKHWKYASVIVVRRPSSVVRRPPVV